MILRPAQRPAATDGSPSQGERSFDPAPGAAVRRLLLVRHGLPDYRGGQRGDEIPGPPVSVIGRAQATQAAHVVRSYAPQAVYASPLSRAQQTAACLTEAMARPVRIEGALREWHRTERLYDVSVRMAGWLVGWLRRGEACAVVVSHASPLLAILRSALYLPHVGWYRTGHPELLEVSSTDRFEVSMASVFELAFEPAWITARCLFHPQPRVLSVWNRRTVASLPRPVVGDGENRMIRRPNWLNLVGHGAWPPLAGTRRTAGGGETASDAGGPEKRTDRQTASDEGRE